MSILVAIGIVATLLLGFLGLTSIETKRGRRYFERTRHALDVQVEEAYSFVFKGGQGNSLQGMLHRLGAEVVHDIVHVTLQAVRLIERTLTRFARFVRGRRKALREENGVE